MKLIAFLYLLAGLLCGYYLIAEGDRISQEGKELMEFGERMAVHRV